MLKSFNANVTLSQLSLYGIYQVITRFTFKLSDLHTFLFELYQYTDRSAYYFDSGKLRLMQTKSHK